MPPTIYSVEELDDALSAPTPAVVEALGRLDGDLLILGVGGKMGPTLARMVRRGLARRASSPTASEERIRENTRFGDASFVHCAP